MPRPVKIDLDRFILMERKNTEERTPCALVRSEFQKFEKLSEIYGSRDNIPASEMIEVYPMFKDENGVFVVVEHLKRMEQANMIESTWVWETNPYF